LEKESLIIQDNPLIWPLLSIIKTSSQSLKVHLLASELQQRGFLMDLDNDANKALFKYNFLLMNALYQLQDLLLPDNWLQVQALDIQLFKELPQAHMLIYANDKGLRSYYLDWHNFETSEEEITQLLNHFWSRYDSYFVTTTEKIDKANALQVFGLDQRASKKDIRLQWRKLAFKWHPDKASGDSVKFREICEAWQTLRLL
jgi:hypothetical protein